MYLVFRRLNIYSYVYLYTYIYIYQGCTYVPFQVVPSCSMIRSVPTFHGPFRSITTSVPTNLKHNYIVYMHYIHLFRNIENRIPRLKKIHFEIMNICGRCKYDLRGRAQGRNQGPGEVPTRIQGPSRMRSARYTIV